ncbi:MAG TPA: hypothetical protein VE079_00480 [Ensifer sp.]|nr:hypothetical protein [Ensifer sp.]
MNRQEENLEIRRMAQEANLDQDLESMVPPTSSTTGTIVMIALLCVLVVAGLALVFTTF